MAYIAADGTVGGKKSATRWIGDFLASIWTIISLFFTTITNPQSLEGSRRTTSSRTYAQRNQGRSHRAAGDGRSLGRGANIRGVSQLGDANCAVGGG